MKIKKKNAASTSSPPKHGPYWSLAGPKAFRKAKDELKLSYQQMAEVLEANRHALWKWYWGMRRPALPMRTKLREEFSIPESDWLTATERKDLEKTVRALSSKTVTKAAAMARKKAMLTLGQSNE